MKGKVCREEPIVINPDIFAEEYIPPNIPAREKQIEELRFCISPLQDGGKPVNAWLSGPPGVGKTSTCRYLQRQLESQTSVAVVYVNCWENNTYFAVLDKMVRNLRILGAERLHTSFKLERLQKYLAKNRVILILDEIDQPERNERNSLLYNLSTLPNVGIVAVCNTRYGLLGLDQRIRSRLSPTQIDFAPYSEDDLAFILKQRATFALHPDSCDARMIRLAAELAEGDARIAIQTLKTAAYLAEKQSEDSIAEKHIRSGHSSVKDLKKTYLLNKLTEHHRLLFDLLRERGPMMSGDFLKAYNDKCASLKIQAIAERTFNLYTKRLSEMGLIQAKRALARGQVREYAAL